MANQSLLTYGSRVSQIEQLYYAPVAVLPPPFNVPIGTIYCFLSHIDPWPDDNNPPVPTEDQAYIKSVFNSMFVAKQVKSNNISPVIQRNDWTSGTIYDYYQDNIDMFIVDNANFPLLKYYIRNKYDQVFKCLWNNNGQPSLNEPYFQPGSYGTNNIFTGTDGYKWKYMYTIDVGSKQKFLDSTWIPVPVGQNVPNPILTSAGYGDIEVINVTNGGSGYDPANAAITVTITGDGYNATGTAVANTQTGQITDIVVTNAGTNYSNAMVTITSSKGSGATAIAPTSPIGGHGFDPISELGARNVILTVEFNGSEGGIIPTDIDYRQVGLIINAFSLDTFPYSANADIYKVSTDFIVAPGFGAYVSDEKIYQGSSLSTATFTATVLSFNVATNTINLININGTPTYNAPVFSTVSGTTRTLLSVSTPKFIPYSGYMVYIQNRTGVQRSSDGIEQFRFVLGY